MYIVIDGSSMLSTNYFGTLPFSVLTAKTDEEKEKAYKQIMQTSDGKYTNGVYTTLKQILNIIETQKPEGIIITFDCTRETFRNKIYSEYKGNRGETPKPLKEQFIMMEKVCAAIGLPTFFSTEYEADDYAGSIAKVLEREGKDVVLISGDKDYYQLISDQTKLWRIIPTPAKQKYEKMYGINFDTYTQSKNLPRNIFEIDMSTGIIADKEILHLTPEQFIDFLAVCGDSIDNIPGVSGVGPNSIAPLLIEYGSLSEIYRTIEKAEIDGVLKELAKDWKDRLGVKKNPINALIAGKDNADLSKELATIKTDIKEVYQNANEYNLNINYDNLAKVIDTLELKSLSKYIKNNTEDHEFVFER